jgi:hypothetical protein
LQPSTVTSFSLFNAVTFAPKRAYLTFGFLSELMHDGFVLLAIAAV